MCDSLYFNLLFRKLSDSSGEINGEILSKLSNFYTNSKNNDVLSMYETWRNNPQIWCLKSDLCPLLTMKITCYEVLTKTEDAMLSKNEEVLKEDTIMIIHVCDEPKNLKKDFQCPKGLLVSEMKYFADYLSSDSPSSTEVDISVHCDVNIFEWLMKYVKRDLLPLNERVYVSSMKPNNTISILISSDFLKMDSLVEECLDYIHDNMNTILSSSLNINCVNPSLILRIADKFSDLELDQISDKKDKIKSALYRKKLEGLFDAVISNKQFTMVAATQLFRCKFCYKLLMRGFNQQISCLDSRLCVSRSGGILYYHDVDESWNVNDQLAEWVRIYRSNNKSTSEATTMLYWRLWAHLNSAECEICGQTFPLYEIGHCRYHLESPKFGKDDSKGIIPIVQGIYNCCGVITLRFDPFRVNKGCKTKDHIVKLSINGMRYTDEVAHLDKILDILACHRDLFEIPFKGQDSERDFITGIIGRDNTLFKRKYSDCLLKDDDDNKPENHLINFVRPRLQPLIRPSNKIRIVKKKVSLNAKNVDELDEDVGDSEEDVHEEIVENNVEHDDLPITVKTGAILLDAPQFPVFNNKKWDNNKSMRYFQDSQRQEDLRRMRQIINYLVSLRINIDTTPKSKLKEFSGGIYCQLEQQWRTECAEKNAVMTANLISQRSQINLKSKQKQLGLMQPFK